MTNDHQREGDGPSPSGQYPPRRHLSDLSQALLRLHKALLDAERQSYERIHGRIESNGAFFGLVLNDPWFAWLRPLSHWITQVDELADDDPSASDDRVATLLVSIRTLLTPSLTDHMFGQHYAEALQQVPDVGLLHAEVKRLLPRSDATTP